MDFETRHNTEENEPELGPQVGSDRDRRSSPSSERFAAEPAPLRPYADESPDIDAIKIFLILAVLTAAMAFLFRMLA